MIYSIQIFYAEAGMFMNTKHESEDLDELKRLAASELFSGTQVRVVDESQHVLFEPPVRERSEELSLSGVAAMLGVPIVAPPESLVPPGEPASVKVGCMLKVCHKYPESPFPDPPFDSPEALQQLKELNDEIDQARIACFYITTDKAREIADRLWPGASLLGATCGKGFHISTADQASVVNEVLSPALHIWFNEDKHNWFLQTWPE
jgi:hypothetical protein